VRVRVVLASLVGLVAFGVAPVAAALPHHHHPRPPSPEARKVEQIRRATDRFHNIVTAEAAGYTPFTDVNQISCIDMPGMGGMGVHLVKGSLIADPAIALTTPEALVYAPDRNGTLRLAALEYLVDKSAWDATHTSPPQLFRGHPFSVTTAPNRFGLPTFYSQHVWAWKANPAGLLAMWNPNVNCDWA
jgi:hypothetical protein